MTRGAAKKAALDTLEPRGSAQTHSDHSTLPAAQREPLLTALSDVIRREGGVVRLEQTTALFLARRC